MRANVLNTLDGIQVEDAWFPDSYWASGVETFVFKTLKLSFPISQQLNLAELPENFRGMPRVIHRYRKYWSGADLSRRSAGEARAA